MRHKMTDTKDSKALTVKPAQPGYSEKDLTLIRNTITKNATPEEFELFMYRAKHLGLDPLKPGQIYFVKYGNNPGTIVIGIDGFRSMASRTGKHAGTKRGLLVDEKTNKCTGAYAEVYRSDWEQPARDEVDMAEYNTGKAMWAKMPRTMIKKCFSKETEVLTEFGFESFPSVSGRILQLTTGGLEPVSTKPFSQKYSGVMIDASGSALRFSVTPEHTMVTTLGRMDATVLYEFAQRRNALHIPLVGAKRINEFQSLSDFALALYGYYLADGFWQKGATEFKISVSRARKIAALEELKLHTTAHIQHTAGQEAISKKSGRIIRTNFDKVIFSYNIDSIRPFIVSSGKETSSNTLLSLSTRQASVLIDALIAFDGHINLKTGVRRFYSSNTNVMKAFEVLCAIANRPAARLPDRISDLSDKTGSTYTISSKNELPVNRMHRFRETRRGKPGSKAALSLRQVNEEDVWCVTVPSGLIIVRLQNGLPIICGNCAEVSALRMAFPEDLGGIYSDDEIEVRDVTEKPVKRVEDSLIAVPKPLPKESPIPARDTLFEKAQEYGWGTGDLKTLAEFTYGVTASKDLTEDEIDGLIKLMSEKPKVKAAVFEENVDGTRD